MSALRMTFIKFKMVFLTAQQELHLLDQLDRKEISISGFVNKQGVHRNSIPNWKRQKGDPPLRKWRRVEGAKRKRLYRTMDWVELERASEAFMN